MNSAVRILCVIDTQNRKRGIDPAMSKKYRKSSHNTRAISAFARPVAPYLAAFLSFLLICLCSTNVIKVTALFVLLAAIVTVCVRFKALREQVALPLTVLGLVVLMDLISTFYAPAGKFALSEFLKVAVSFALVLIVLALPAAKEVDRGRRIAALLSRVAAFFSLISIDLLSTRILSGIVTGFLSLFTPDYYMLSGVEAGVRMTSLLGNPNVFAGIAGIGVLLGLSLSTSAEQGKQRKGHIVCLFINALAFVLAFSMGATAMIAVAFVVYLLLEHKDSRIGLFVLMVETLIVTLLGVIPVAMTSLQEWVGFQPIPLLCVIVGAALLCVLDHFVGRPMEEKLGVHGKKMLIAVIALVVVFAAFAAAACTLTGPADLAKGETLLRGVYPAAGEYTVSAQASGSVTVVIESQNETETMMHTSTVLYQGELSDAAFTVPEDSMVVYFNFIAGEDVRLEQVSYVGNGVEEEVPLGYKLLPGFIANRIQGLFANQNAIQRTVFFEDGMKIFRRSPVVGVGLGGYENGILGVQSFYYETKYAHNHYVQALTETGVIGLALFVGLLAVSAWAILRARRREGAHFLVPALGAALVFMAGHAAVEVVFSFYAYLPIAFGVFALINLCCGDAVSLKVLSGKVKGWVTVVFAAILAVFTVLLFGNLRAFALVNAAPTFQSLDQAIAMDKYEWSDHMLSYVNNVDNAADVPEVQQKAAQYAAELAKLDSNTIPVYLAEFYFKRGETEQGIAMLEKYVNYVSSDQGAWQRVFYMLQAFAVDTDEFRADVEHIYRMMETWNAENMGQVTLNKDNLEFLASLGIQ